MTKQTAAPVDARSPSPPALYSPHDLAELLSVSLRTVRSWIRSGDLPHIRLGPGERLIRVKHQDLEVFLNRRYKNSSTES